MSDNSVWSTLSRSYIYFHYFFSLLLIFLLPVKFGNMVGVPEVPIGMDNPYMWLLGTYPPIYFTIVAVLFFLSSLIASSFKVNIDLNYAGIYVISFFIIAFVSLIGFLKASVMDFPITFSLHFFGLAIFAGGVLLTIKLNEDFPLKLLRALVLGTIVSLFFSFQQLIYGFKESLEFVKASEARTGMKISMELLNRLEQTRVYAPFSLCNSLGAHLILMIPVVSVMCFFDRIIARWGIVFSSLALFLIFFDSGSVVHLFFLILIFSFVMSLVLTSFFDEHWQKVCKVYSVLMCIFMFYILYHTFSRAAVVSLIFSFLLLVMFLFRGVKYKMLYILVVVFSGLIFFLLVNQGRKIFTLSSLHVRVDYCLRGLEIFKNNFLFGTGWGDFFHEYTQIKRFPGAEAPHTAHNIIIDFASQCGILGFLFILLLYFVMIYYLFLALKKKGFGFDNIKFCRLAIFAGIVAWGLHSLTDVNFQVPGTVASVIVMFLVATNDLKMEKKYISLRYANFAVLAVSIFVLYFAWERMCGEYYFFQLYQICEPVIIDEKSPEKYSYGSMMDALKSTVEAMPYSPYPWASAGNYAQRRGNWELAEKYYFEALKRSPERASFYYRLGLSQIMNGNIIHGLENLKLSSEMFPNNEEFKQKYEIMKKKLEAKK